MKTIHTILIITFILVSSIFSGVFAQGSDAPLNYEKEILLQSRQFTPEEKMPQDVKNLLEAAANQYGKIHVLMQLDHIPDKSEREALKNQGITLLDYIPYNAWFAVVTKKGLDKAKQKTDIIFIDYIRAADKISPAIRTEGLENEVANKDDTIKLQVLFFNDVSKADATGIIKKYGKIIEAPVAGNGYLIEINKGAVSRLANEDKVQWLEREAPGLQEDNDGARQITNVETLQKAPYNLDGSGVIVAMWDSGLPDHVDFNARKTIADKNAAIEGHATHVAGTMLGDGTNSANAGAMQLKQWRGMAPNAKLVSYDWPSNSNEVISETNDAVTNYKAILSQNAWGTMIYGMDTIYGPACNFGEYTTRTQAYDKIINGDSSVIQGGKQISIIFSAGNNQSSARIQCGFDYGTVRDPGGTAKNTIVVGSVMSDTKEMTATSSWGPTKDGRLKPEIVAPGCARYEFDGGITSTTDVANLYEVRCGTSMSSAAATGIIALIIQDWKSSHSTIFEPRPATVKALLAHTATDLESKGPDFKTGYGLIDAKAAIDLVTKDDSGNNGDLIKDGIPLLNGNSIPFYTNIADGTPELKVTVAWDDYPATPNAGKKLVNDLDLLAIAPDGIKHYPWTLSGNNPPALAARNSPNTVDNIEQVLVENPAGGKWTIEVKATSVPQPAETFSLVSTHPLANAGCSYAQDKNYGKGKYGEANKNDCIKSRKGAIKKRSG